MLKVIALCLAAATFTTAFAQDQATPAARKLSPGAPLEFVPQNAAEAREQADACKAQVDGYLRQADWVKNMEVEDGKVILYAGSLYLATEFATKQVIAESVNCAVRIWPEKCASIDVRHGQTGKTLAKYRDCKLQPE